MTDKTAEAAWNEAFAKAQGELPDIGKNKTANAGSYSYKYADLADVIKAVRSPLAKHNLSVAQDVSTQQGQVSVTTRIYHMDGHFEEFGPLTLAAGSTAQAAGGAITYARRYALCAALNIAADEDTDGAHVEAPKKKTQRSQARESAKAEPQTEEVSPTRAASSVSPTSSEPYVDALKKAVENKRKHGKDDLSAQYVAHAVATAAREQDYSPPPVPETQFPADYWKWIQVAPPSALAATCALFGLEPSPSQGALTS